MNKNLTYYQEGDYLIPDLAAPEDIPVGIWGMRRRDYLKLHRNGIYTGMLLSGRLSTHLAEIDRQEAKMFAQLTRQMMAEQGVTEQLKAENQMAWVGAMNNVRRAVEEVILKKLIYSRAIPHNTQLKNGGVLMNRNSKLLIIALVIAMTLCCQQTLWRPMAPALSRSIQSTSRSMARFFGPQMSEGTRRWCSPTTARRILTSLSCGGSP